MLLRSMIDSRAGQGAGPRPFGKVFVSTVDDAVFSRIGGVDREGAFLAGLGVVAMAIAGLDADLFEGVIPAALIVAAVVVEADPQKLAAPRRRDRR